MSNSWIPKRFKQMMVTFRQVDPNGPDADLIDLEKDFQREARVQASFSRDKAKAVKQNKKEIERVKGYIKEAHEGKDPQANAMLEGWEEWLDRLYQARFGLFRDAILRACKERGMFSPAKLASFPGSPEYMKKRKEERENNRKSKLKDA